MVLKSLNLKTNKKKFDGYYIDTIINNEKVIFLKPLLYMNLSGIVVKKYMDFFKIDSKDILIINDDLDLKLGTFKLKSHGSSGGHNGLKNIEENIKTDSYKRIKIGISNNKNIDTKDYVLGKLNNDDNKILDEVIKEVINVLNDYFNMSFDLLQSKYNHK